MLSFEEILNKPVSETERPKPVPAGTYTALVKGMPEYGESNEKKTPFARFVLELIETEDDIDPDQWQGKTLRKDCWLTEDSLWRSKEFIEHCGVDFDGSEMSYREGFEACSGCQLLVTVKHRAQRDGDGVFAEISKTAPLE